MRSWLVQAVVLSLAWCVVGGEGVQAAGPGGRTSILNRSWFSTTVTTTVLQAQSTDVDAVATYEVVTVATRIGRWSWTCTQSSLTVTVSSSAIEEGSTVQVVYGTPGGGSSTIGTTTATNGTATFSLSTKQGETVPVVQEGDFVGLYFINPSGEFEPPPARPFFFGAPVTTVTTCGR